MLETAVSIIVALLGIEEGMARLDGPGLAWIQPGDPAVLWRVDRTDDGPQWTRLGQSTVVDDGSGLALVDTVGLADVDPASLHAVIDVPAARLPSIPAAPDLRTIVDPQALDAAVTALIPEDERIELAVLRVLERRWAARSNETTAPAAPTPTPTFDESRDLEGPSSTDLAAASVLRVAVADMAIDTPESTPESMVVQETSDASPDVTREDAPTPREPPSNGLLARVHAWADAWATQRTDDYLDFYAADFVPSSHPSRDAWVVDRRTRLTTPASITVTLEDVVVRVVGADRAEATFVQHYRSDRFEDTVRKRLDLIWERDDWRILGEGVVTP